MLANRHLLIGIAIAATVASCLGRTPPPQASPSHEPTNPGPVSLPPTWTPTPTLTLAATATPSITPTSTPTSPPRDTPTKPPPGPTATTLPPKVTSLQGSPEATVERAFQAYLDADEGALSRLLNEDGLEFCEAFHANLLDCIGSAYQGLRSLQEWYVIPWPDDPTPHDSYAYALVITRWRNSETALQHLFSLHQTGGRWLIWHVVNAVFPYP
jgi:hypothetical protein